MLRFLRSTQAILYTKFTNCSHQYKGKMECFFSRYLYVLCSSAFVSDFMNRGKENQAFITTEVCCAMLFGFVCIISHSFCPQNFTIW